MHQPTKGGYDAQALWEFAVNGVLKIVFSFVSPRSPASNVLVMPGQANSTSIAAGQVTFRT